MARKELTTHFEAIAELKEANDTSIQGVIANVNPMKQGAMPYFDAQLCDGEKQVRLVGFSSAQRKRLASLQDTID